MTCHSQQVPPLRMTSGDGPLVSAVHEVAKGKSEEEMASQRHSQTAASERSGPIDGAREEELKPAEVRHNNQRTASQTHNTYQNTSQDTSTSCILSIIIFNQRKEI